MSKPASEWSSPDDLRAQVLRLWDRGALLRARFETEPRYPLRLDLRRPSRSELSTRFDEVRRWIRALEDGAKREGRAGYEIVWSEINHRQLGRNRVPRAAVVATEADALALIGKEREGARFTALVEATGAAHPKLEPWVARYPLRLLEQASDWPRVLAVLSWFVDHPRSGLYLRQLDVPGVDTKFIEARVNLLSELLEWVLPASAIDGTATGSRVFEKRYGLRAKPTLVRLRCLDPGLTIAGLSDVTAPVEEVSRLDLSAQRVVIVENDVTGLAFPALTGGVLLFGGGYALERLASIAWLAGKPVHYWGDLDTHGFAILGRLRAHLPGVCSLLMDRETLLHHRGHWVHEAEEQRHLGRVERLTEAEEEVLHGLVNDTWGGHVRLEQERIGFGWVQAAVGRISG